MKLWKGTPKPAMVRQPELVQHRFVFVRPVAVDLGAAGVPDAVGLVLRKRVTMPVPVSRHSVVP